MTLVGGTRENTVDLPHWSGVASLFIVETSSGDFLRQLLVSQSAKGRFFDSKDPLCSEKNRVRFRLVRFEKIDSILKTNAVETFKCNGTSISYTAQKMNGYYGQLGWLKKYYQLFLSRLVQ